MSLRAFIRSGTAAETIQDFESRGSDPKLGTVQRWRRALEEAGVEFIDASDGKGPGVRLSSEQLELALKPRGLEKRDPQAPRRKRQQFLAGRKPEKAK